jgi:micrococcal nuclease
VGIVLLSVALAATGCGGGSPAADDSASQRITAASAAAAATGQAPKGETASGLSVTRVVDGDTIHVDMDGRDVTVRLIGIDTPETVKPDSPVECFGPEASDFGKSALTGQTITLEFDASQGREDQYGRTLAYVWTELPDGGLSLFNLQAVEGGYAVERQYGPTPYAWKAEFRDAQKDAKSADAGLWGACP